MWILHYLHQTAAFSFSTHKKACGDAGDLGKKDRHKQEEKQSEWGQEEVNESFIKWMNAVHCCTATRGSLATNQQALIAPQLSWHH